MKGNHGIRVRRGALLGGTAVAAALFALPVGAAAQQAGSMDGPITAQALSSSEPSMSQAVQMTEASGANGAVDTGGATSSTDTVAQASVPDDSRAATETGSRNDGVIVVTAQKREQEINDVGLTVAALSGEMLENRQIDTLADLALAVPGLSYTNSGSNTPVYTLRGIGFYETTLGAYPSVSVYLDEAPLPFPVLTTNTAFDLERVEVLKGPQGTLFGNNATGGAINYIAAKPTNAFEAGATLGYGRFDTITAEGYVSGPLSDSVGIRVAGRAVNSGDWQRGYTFDGTTGKTETYAARMLLDIEATDRLRIQLNLNGWLDKSDPQAVQFIQYRPNFPGASSPVEDYPVYTGSDNRDADFTESINPHSDNRLWQAVGRVDFDVTDGMTLTSLTSYIDYDQDMAYDGDGVTLRDFDVPLFEGQVTSFSQELRLANSGASDFRWVLGANYARDSADDNYILIYRDSTVFSAAGIETSGYRSNQDMKNYAGFANGEIDVGDFTLKAGVRYTKAEREASSCFYVFPGPSLENFRGLYQFLQDLLRSQNGLPPAGPIDVSDCLTIDNTGLDGNPPTYIPGEFRGTLNEDNWSFRTGVDWKPNPDTLVYFNVAKGYKAGSFPSAAAATTAQLLGVKQESLLSYELGLKATVLDGSLQANAAAFYYDYKDKQLRSKLLDPIFGVLDALVNIPESDVKGFELELNATPTDGLNIYANFVYIDSKIKEFEGFSGAGVFADFAGSPFPYAPKYSVGTGFNYQFPVSDSLDAFVGSDLSYSSDTTAIIGNAPGYEIDSYALLDVRAGIESSDERWRFQVWGKNVTDEYYWTNVASYYDTVARYAGRPATYGATLSYRFN